MTEKGHGGGVELDAHRMGARLLAGIADAGSRRHAPVALKRAHARQDGFEQRGLATLKGSDQGDAARRWLGPLLDGSLSASTDLNHRSLPDRKRAASCGGPDRNARAVVPRPQVRVSTVSRRDCRTHAAAQVTRVAERF